MMIFEKLIKYFLRPCPSQDEHEHEHEHEHHVSPNDQIINFLHVDPNPQLFETNLRPHPHPSKCPCHSGSQDFLLSDDVNIKLEPGKEVDKNIQLEPNPFKGCSTLSGTVRDKKGCPIENALVKIFDSHHHPVTHVFSNKEGQFLFYLNPGDYILKAVR